MTATAPETIQPSFTRLVLIRHGESASNAGRWISGQDSCGGLTPLGVAQAEALRDRLAVDPSLRPDVVLVSTMPRAVHTAEIVAEPSGLGVVQRADLIERTSGEAEGLTIDEYVERYGMAPWSDWDRPLSPGGESGEEFATRVLSATDDIVAQHRGATVWVVCHGGVIMVSAARRWTPGGASAATSLASLPIVSPVNTSVSEWLVDANDVWRMNRYNDHTHLVGVSDPDASAPAAL